ncbi:hypothetical protein LJC15_05790 [Desulfovibrio sp. OttesenSCG-928-G11]|nr:hypothetical protein [Desulfovibrio sp. OttesenSCG-928-G11]
MTRDGGISARFTAYALALELGWSDVDAMLESMTAMQYREWLAFFKRRNEAPDNKPTNKVQMAGSLSKALDGYQNRRDRLKGR